MTGPTYTFLPFAQYVSIQHASTPTNSTGAQLNVSAATGVALGQKHQKKEKAAYAMPSTLTGTPSRPSDQRARGSVSVRRRYSTHEMEMQYEAISATIWSEMMALKAVEEPMLMSDSRMVKVQVSVMALAGIWSLGCTCPIHFAKGKPLSRANANVCRLVDALKGILHAMARSRMTTVRVLTPPIDTALRKTYRKGKPVGSFRAASTEGRQKRYVTTKKRPSKPFSTKEHTIALGTFRPASFTSSDMWAVASEPDSAPCVSNVITGERKREATKGQIWRMSNTEYTDRKGRRWRKSAPP
jgi:hypothetical protein